MNGAKSGVSAAEGPISCGEARPAPYIVLQTRASGDGAVAQANDIAERATLNELLIATAAGDRQAFARLYKLSAPILFAISLRTMRQREEAEEALQEAFVSIWKNAGRYRSDRGQPLSWMIAIVRYRAIDRMRRQKRAPASAATLEDVAETIPTTNPGFAPLGVAEQTLRHCLDELKPKPQQAIALAYYHGLTHEELATRLDTPLGTVKSWVRRGLAQLKECLDR